VSLVERSAGSDDVGARSLNPGGTGVVANNLNVLVTFLGAHEHLYHHPTSGLSRPTLVMPSLISMN
jgi:hypothetical protein